MSMYKLATLLCTVSLAGCAGVLPEPGGSFAGPRTTLPPCAQWPNCVTTESTDPMHAIAPMRLAVPPEQAWPALRGAVELLPETRIVTDTGQYLHAESRSGRLGFVDDLNVLLRPGSEMIAIRSASRVGLNDLGANLRRVETIRNVLLREGVIR
jgi:uncharacterized protein (DUF1499 family)